MDKAALRDEARRRRLAIPLDARRSASEAAQTRVLGLREFACARTVFCFVAVRDEIGTDRLLSQCKRAGVTVCVPAYDERADVYRPARWPADGTVRKGPMGISEPATPVWVSLEGVDVAVVPGLAFDEQGGRLGYGGGHYDRMLKDFAGFRVGLAFEAQICGCVPMTAGDVRMDAIVTERRVIRIQ